MSSVYRAHDPSKSGLGPIIGRRVGDRLVLGKKSKTRHMLRTPRAWAIDSGILVQAQRDGCRTVEFLETEEARRWTAPLRLFRERGIPLERGRGVQIALPERFWTVDPPLEPSQLGLTFETRN